ncbi:MAG: KH domain-containing protein [Acidimicrobiales bacterium]
MSDTLAPTAEAVLLHLCRSVVSSPDDVSVEASSVDDARIRFDVTVNKDDMGRVIGRRGRVASAIRTVVGAAGAKDGVTTEVEFVE